MENKTAVAVYGVGAVVLLWFSSTIVSAVNSVPLVRLWQLPEGRFTASFCAFSRMALDVSSHLCRCQSCWSLLALDTHLGLCTGICCSRYGISVTGLAPVLSSHFMINSGAFYGKGSSMFHCKLQSSRQELIQDVDELKKKITGAAEE